MVVVALKNERVDGVRNRGRCKRGVYMEAANAGPQTASVSPDVKARSDQDLNEVSTGTVAMYLRQTELLVCAGSKGSSARS